jgi:hypothetical protein
MSQRTKDPKVHARIILLPANVDAALVKAAKKEGRATRIHAAKLLAAALGLACLVLAGCSGEAGGPLVGAERGDAGQVVDDAGDAARVDALKWCENFCCDDGCTRACFATDGGDACLSACGC